MLDLNNRSEDHADADGFALGRLYVLGFAHQPLGHFVCLTLGLLSQLLENLLQVADLVFSVANVLLDGAL